MLKTFRNLNISGQVFDDEATLKNYSIDMSHYAVKPRLVAIPENEDDVAKIIDYSKEEDVSLTCRGAGSNQSGSSVGSGIVVLFSGMNRIIHRSGSYVTVQPGVVYAQLDRQLREVGLNLPYDPSSRSFCTIGGNVATKASGIRSIKYGSVDSALRSLRFFDLQHGLVDTSESLPADLESAILGFRDRIRNDEETKQKLLRQETVKSSSGYNLKSFFNYESPEQIITHLMAGSVGTLSVFTEIELESKATAKSSCLCLLFFPSLTVAAENAVSLRGLNPSALELLDAYCLNLLQSET